MKRLITVLIIIISLTVFYGCKNVDDNNGNNDKPPILNNENISVSVGLEYVKNGDGYVVSGIGTCNDIAITVPQFYNNLPVLKINYGAFNYNNSIETISIPSTVTVIDDYAFNGCKNLRLLTIRGESNLKTVGSYAFSDCEGLYSFNFPKSLKVIDSYAFANCYALNSVTYDSGSQLQRINAYAFLNCRTLTGMWIPKTVNYIDKTAFEGCKNLITNQ